VTITFSIRNRLYCGAAISLLGLLSLPAAAAEGQPARSDATPAATTDQDVVVTATKRASTVQKVPAAISAFTGKDLLARGVTSVSDLVAEIPGVSMKSSGPGQTEFEMRGLSSSGGSSPTVGFYLDDTPLTAPAGAQNGKVTIDPNLYDLNRIEVLRGPQGTLYGAGSMGGTIRLITNKPDTGRYQASAQVILSGTDGGGFNHTENAMVNVPLVQDILALRVVGSEARTSGWIDRIVVGDFPVATDGGARRGDMLSAPVQTSYRDVNDIQLYGIRASMLFKPTDRLSITPSVFWQKMNQGGPSTIDSDPGTPAHYQAFDIREPFSDKFFSFEIPITYRFDGFDITSVTANWNRTQNAVQDSTENVQLGFGLPSVYSSGGGLGPSSFQEIDKTRQFSEELRLTSQNSGKFQWIIGAFYSQYKFLSVMSDVTPETGSIIGTTNNFSFRQHIDINQIAGFGELSYSFTDKLKFTTGLRYYSYDTSVHTLTSGYGSQTGSDASASDSGAASNSGFNPKFNLSYQARSDLMVYANVAKGFRPGSANTPVPNNPDTIQGANCLNSLQALGRTSAPASYRPDEVWSYELGGKFNPSNRLLVNAAVYHSNWKNIQQYIPLTCGFPFTDNAGTAAVWGAELETRLVLTPGLSLSGNIAYTDAHLTQNVPEAGLRAGDPVQNVARWSGSAALSYVREMGGGWNFNARGSYNYVGSRIDATYGINHLPAYGLVNLRIGIANGPWNFYLFDNNATNKRASISNNPSLSINLPTFNRVSTNQPMTIGLGIERQFN